jgi:hypothetical protein
MTILRVLVKPNITGSIGTIHRSFVYSVDVRGCFKSSSNQNDWGAYEYGASGGCGYFNFDATRSSSAYATGGGVHTKSSNMNYVIKY